MTARLEAWLYSSGTQGDQDATQTITVTEPGPIQRISVLPSPMVLTDALAWWASDLTASALVGTYSLVWNATTQGVDISATGVASFTAVLSGDLRRVLGHTSGTLAAAASYPSDVPSLARFDAMRLATTGVMPHEDAVQMHSYRHGRHRAVAWTDADTMAGELFVARTRADDLLTGYCSAGRVRVYPDESVAVARAPATPGGYVDAYVVALEDAHDASARSRWVECRLVVAVPR